MDRWDPPTPPDPPREALAQRVNARADRLGSATLDPAKPVIATGHQAWLWHPGILAKGLAAVGAARARGDSGDASGGGGQPLHLVVDQDQHPALALDVPTHDGDRLGIRTLQLAHENLEVPPGFQPPADAAVVLHTLRQWGGTGANRLVTAWSDLPETRSLAEQVALVVDRLRSPWTGPVPMLMTSDFAGMPAFEGLIDAMLADPAGCVKAYNDAVKAHPVAGVARLMAASRRVELPLWACQWNTPRQKVYADIGGGEASGGGGGLLLGTGEALDREQWTLLPTALTQTAVMRSALCDRFIHGTGGGVYDRVTEDWLTAWRGRGLNPMAVATADVALGFEAPVASLEDLRGAVWWRHHLPHNLDRTLALDGERVAEKHRLLHHMDDDRDRARRRAAFDEIHRINDELVVAHPEAIAAADAQLQRCRAGVANAAVAAKRDWCFALYPEASIAELAERLGVQSKYEINSAGFSAADERR